MEKKMVREEMETEWELLKNGIQLIQNKNVDHIHFEQLYTIAYKMVLNSYGEKLYSYLEQVITDHLKMKVRPNVLASVRINFLHTLYQAWVDHETSMTIIKDIVAHLDRMSTSENKLTNIYDLGVILFRDQIACYKHIKDHLRERLLDIVMQKRCREKVYRLEAENAWKMLIQLGIGSQCVYEEIFEKPFLMESADFYRMESQQLLEDNVSEYIKIVEKRINEEIGYYKYFLKESTGIQHMEVVLKEFISMHMNSVVEMENSGLIHMLKNKNMEEASSLYKLFIRVPDGIEIIVKCVTAYLKEQGTVIVSENGKEGDFVAFITRLLALKDEFDYFLCHAFNGDEEIQQMITRNFEYILSLNSKSPEYLSLFIDDKLKRFNSMTDQEIEQILDKSVVLFRCLEEKDIFESYYKKHLAKRLLLDKSVSNDSEKNMISKLKNECEPIFTYKLETMMKDVTVTDSSMAEFKAHIIASGINLHNVDFHLKVFTTGIWPMRASTLKCNIPVAARNAFEAFREFYLAKHLGRRLSLQPQFGSADLIAFFSQKQNAGSKKESLKNSQQTSKNACSFRKHIIQVSTYQMCVLMLFNTADSLTFEEISNETDIPEKDLVQTLQSLVMGKASQRILIKMPQTKNIEPNHQFAVNDSFSSKFYKVKIKTVSLKCESVSQQQETQIKVNEDRRYQVDAAIVRIIKEKKCMKHAVLVAEVTEKLKCRFLPDPLLIKKRIESLMEREYLARSNEDMSVYTYVL